jgi:MFS family permease
MFSWDAEEPQTRVDYWIYVSVVIASLTMIQAGFNIGLTSGAILIVQERFGLSSLEKEAVMASLNISAIFGVFIINYISDWKGRKSAIVCSSFILAVGFFITVFSKGFISFLVARSKSFLFRLYFFV